MILARATLAAAMILMLATSPLIGHDATAAGSGFSVYAAPAAGPSQDNHDNGNDNRNSNNDNGGNDNDDSDDNGADDNDDDDGGPPAQPVQIARPAPTPCTSPGQESTVTSDDGRVTVRVFGTMPRPIRMSIRLPLDAGVAPAPPGPVFGGLLFQVIAEECGGGPIPVVPAEVNLGARYADADAAGLYEASVTIARLDTNTNQWRAVEKQAADAAANFASATIADMGYYVVYQR